jgi:hypothetical protein
VLLYEPAAIGVAYSSRGPTRSLCAQERGEAFAILVAGGAALEVSAHADHRGVGVAAGKLELDVSVEVLKALLARELGARGAQHQA